MHFGLPGDRLYQLAQARPHNVLHFLVILHVCLSTQNPVTISENCDNGQDMRASYELSYTSDSGTLNTTCVIDWTECSNGTCRHVLQNNTADSRCQPPVSQLSGESVTVSLTARNIVGESNTSESRGLSEFFYNLENDGSSLMGAMYYTSNNLLLHCLCQSWRE